MKQNLNLKQSQSLVMTPQLQQAIKLLQLSNLELAEYVENEIERNPLLERVEGDHNDADTRDDRQVQDAPSDSLQLNESSGMNEAREAMDAPSEDMYEPGTGSDSPSASSDSGPSATTDWSNAGSGKGGGENFNLENILEAQISLKDHLHEQLTLACLTPAQQLIGAQLIAETDDGGYCRANLEEISELLGTDIPSIEEVLNVCQGFDPTGVMARSIPECLMLQLKDQNRFDPAIEALLANLDLLAKHDIKKLSELCGVTRDEVEDMIRELRTLTPRPGAGFATDAAISVTPDVYVRELPNGAYSVELNAENLPRVLMNNAYYAEVSALPMKENEKDFITECATNASWLVKSLDQRARTILKVSREIVRQQDAFFAMGVAHLKPLNLRTVADAIDMHESTVSRVTSNKYMSTPRGLLELKYFFSAAIPSTGGGVAHSAEAVRHRIKALIDAEVEGSVYSDDQIVEILTGYGIEIARRTVAKYRESMNIPSSVQRRRLMKRSA